MSKFQMQEVVGGDSTETVKLGTATDQLPTYTTYADTEIGKFVKLAGDSRYSLCAVGDQIEGRIVATESAPVDGYCLGTIQTADKMRVTLDGLQATPGTGVAVIGNYVVCSTPTAKGTSLAGVPAKACVITDPTTVGGLLAFRFQWRIVAIYGATGAVGTQALVERVNGD